MEENVVPVCAAAKHAFPPRAHAPTHAHKQTAAIPAYDSLPPASLLPFVSHAFAALFPLIIFAVLLWVALTLRRGSKKQQQQQQQQKDGGAWVRPLVNVPEVVSAVGALFDTFNICNVLWLASSQPIAPHHVRLALTQVAQKVELLQLVVAWRWLWPWYRRMAHLEVDFSVEVDDPLEVCRRQLHATYCLSKGPLWRARLVPMSPQGPGQHRAALVLSFHHALADGTTNLFINKDVLHALNAAASGRSPSLPSRYLVPAITSRTAASRYCLPSLGFVLSACRTALTTALSRNSILRHLPRPGAGRPVTRFKRHEFSAEATDQLLARSRGAGVRVHSCITAAAGLALHRTVQHFAGRRLDAVHIIQEQAVNMRRYHPEHSEATGSMAFLTTQQHTIRDGPDTFWPLAHAIQAKLDRSLEVTRAPLRTGYLGWLCSAIIPINLVLARLGFTSFSYSHICSSNMGDLRRLLGSGEDAGGPVRLIGLLRTTAAELAGSMCCLNCQTLEGRLTVSLDYYTNKMTDDAANTFFTHLTHTLTEVAERGSPPPPCTHQGRDGNG